jgi:hypothetical protein
LKFSKQSVIDFASRFQKFLHAAVLQNPAASEEKLRESLYRWDNWRQTCREYNLQQRCSHCKGTKHGVFLNADYNISLHTFVDGGRRIRCLNNCGFEVWDKSGWRLKWAFAEKMLDRTTNIESSSQQPLLGIKVNGDIFEYFNDTPEGRAKLKEKYPLWNGSTKPSDVTTALSFYTGYDRNAINLGDDENPIKGKNPVGPYPKADEIIVSGEEEK